LLVFGAVLGLTSCASIGGETRPEQKFYFGGYLVSVFLDTCEITNGRIIGTGGYTNRPSTYRLNASANGTPVEFDVKCDPVRPDGYGACTVERHALTYRKSKSPVCSSSLALHDMVPN
jgi:hypothetical protein